MTDMGLQIKISADGKQASAELSNLNNQVNKLDSNLNSSSVSANKQSASLASLARNAAAAAAAYVTVTTALVAVKAAVEASDRFAMLEGRLKLATSSAQQFTAVYGELYRISQNTASDLEANVSLYNRMARAFEGTGRSASDMLAIVKVMAQSLRISGASTQEAQSAILQFSQAMASGKLQGEEFRSLMESTPNLMYAIAKAAGIPREEFKQLASEGKLTAKVIADAMVQMRETFDQQANALPSTFGQAFQRLQTSLQAWMAEVAKASGLVTELATAMNSLSGFFDRWRTTGTTSSIKEQQELVNQLGEKLVTLKARGAGIGDVNYAQRQFDEADTQLQNMIAAERDALKVTEELGKGFGDVGYKIENVGKKAEDTIAAVAQAARSAGIPESFAVTIAKLESGFQQSAVSNKGATGVMQLMPQYFGKKGDINNAMENIRIGVEELARLYKKYDGDLVKVMAAYNGGEGNLARYGTGAKYVQEYIAAYDKAAQSLKSKYPNGLLSEIMTPKQQAEMVGSQKDLFTAQLERNEAAAKAFMDRMNQNIDGQIAQQKAKIQEFQNARNDTAGELTGANKVAYEQQAAEQQKKLAAELNQLELAKIANEERYAQVKLANINAIIAKSDQFKLTEQQRLALDGQRLQAESALSQVSSQRQQLELESGQRASDAADRIANAQREQTAAEVQKATAIAEYLQQLDDQIAKLQDQNNVLGDEAKKRELLVGLTNEQADAVEREISIRESKIKTLEDANKKQADEAKSVKDDVLRMSQYYQAMTRQAQQAAQGMAEAFGKTGAAIGQVITGLAQYQESMYQIEQRKNALLESNSKNGNDPAKAAQIEQQAMMEGLSAQTHQYGNLTQAAQSFFKEGTAGYNAMASATKAFRMMEMALTLSNYAKMAAEGISYTATAIGNLFQEGQATATVAVANQGKGDPYTAFARIAAMAALMAAIGFGVMGANSSGGAQGAAASVTPVNGGTVLGDENAKSASLANSLEILKKNSSADLDYSSKMTRSLENIENAIAGVTNSLLINVNALTALQGQSVKWVNNNKGIFGEPTLFMNTRSKISDFGIGTAPWNPQLLSDILKNGLELKSYTDVTTTTKLFGMTMSSKTKTYLGEVAKETENAFTRVIRSLADAVKEGAKAFGISSVEFEKRLAEFTVSIDPVSLKGEDGKKLTGTALQEALSAQFSSIADRMAQALNIDQLQSFQRASEGLFETLVRVSSGINEANGALGELNIKSASYLDVVNRQAEDVGAEIVRQSIIAKENGTAVGQFFEDVTGSVSDMIDTYKNLVAIRDLFTGMGFDTESLTRAMTEAVGGVQKLRDAMESFNSNFFTDGEQLGNQLVTLGRQFGELGQTLPQSKDEFRALVESIDTSTEAGQKLFARLVALSGAFADAADAADALQKKYEDYTNPRGQYTTKLEAIIKDFESILDAKLGQIEATYANKAALEKQQANAPLQDQVDYLTQYRSVRQSEIERNFGFLNTTLSEIQKYQDLIARWEGVPKAAAYVASWRTAMSGMQEQADILRGDLAAKKAEIDKINAQIQSLLDQMAANNSSIDAAATAEKIKALDAEKKLILRQEGEVLLSSLRDFWDQMMSGIEDLQKSIARKIAELQGGNAIDRLNRSTMRDSNANWREFKKSGAEDPEKAARLIQDMIDSVMSVYESGMSRIQKQIDRQTNEINRQLEKDINAINRRRDRQLSRVDNQEQRLTEEAQRKGEEAIKRINEQLDIAMEKLDEKHLAETRALQDEQEARREAIQKTHDAELEALQEQLNTANQLKAAIEQIAQYAKQLKTGSYSSLSPEDKLAEAQRQYQELLAKAQAGDADAASKLTGSADTLLQLLQQYYGSNPAYAELFDAIQKQLEGLGGQTVTDPNSVQSKIDALREEQAKEMKELSRTFENESRALSKQQSKESEALRATFQARIDAVNERTNKNIERIQRQMDEQRDAINKAADKQIRQLEREASRAIKDLSDPDKNEAIKALRDRTIKRLERMNELLEAEKEKAKEQMRLLINEVKNLGILSSKQLRQLNKMAENWGIPTVPAAAAGGYFGRGPVLVGENGPELVNFSNPARIIDNNTTNGLLNGNSDKIAKAIENLKEEIKAVVNTQSAANPIIVDKLSKIDEKLASVERTARLSA